LFSPPFSATDVADEERRASVHPGAVSNTPGREAGSPSVICPPLWEAPSEGGVSLGTEAGVGNPLHTSMPTFVSDCVFLSEYVAFGGPDDLRNIKEFFSP